MSKERLPGSHSKSSAEWNTVATLWESVEDVFPEVALYLMAPQSGIPDVS